MTADCEHGAACHFGGEPAQATAPEASRAWLLVEHDGPWPAEPADADLPPDIRATIMAAESSGVRVQLIRKPGRLRMERGRAGRELRPPRVFAGWTGGGPWTRDHGQWSENSQWSASDPCDGHRLWLREGTAAGLPELDLAGLTAGERVTFGSPTAEPLYLVCAHGRRDACCARFGVPLARELAGHYPDQVWETTHVGGHRYAANLVILPHGLYYGPVEAGAALRAIGAYERGEVSPERYRGRAGQPRPAQEAEHALLRDRPAPLLLPQGI
jgi:hypothetical protein